MKLGDLCLFYHSGAKARRVVGVVTVVREWYLDGGDDGMVDVKEVGEMRRPVDLKEMKGSRGSRVLLCLGSRGCRLCRFLRMCGLGFVIWEVGIKVMVLF
ncbi:thymocyte nuclear protein 1 [Prunus yedoensis var. nudiflora]|uniref:Thymocyte nuclear protein 1 n=1 Tax=Prunus yedoensis var. nudiflora TaxID=2094558 RepID=A0A314ZUX2_PRUYE|nr:thymocyte nuclear protein 1 [Prunus yedoensis var. nudiflora]